MSKSRLVLHRAIASPPARACMMLADIIHLKMEYRDVNIIKMEHKTPQFKQLNPMCTVPVLENGDFVLSESNAIMKYLLSKYGADHQERLYPADLKQRALVDQCMFFTAGVLFTALRNVGVNPAKRENFFQNAVRELYRSSWRQSSVALIRSGLCPAVDKYGTIMMQETLMSNLEAPTDKHKAAIENSYGIMDAYLQTRPYIATDRLTLADLSAGATATAIQVMHKVNKDKFPRCADWLARLDEEQFFKTVNKEGVDYFGKLLNAFWERNRRNNKQKAKQ